MQHKTRMLLPPGLSQQQQQQSGVAIRQSRPVGVGINVANGKPMSNGTPPIQRPGSAGGGITGVPGAGTGAGGIGNVGVGAGGLTVPQQQRHGSGSPHDNRGGSPLRPLSGMANGANGMNPTTNGVAGTNGVNGLAGMTGFPAYQQLNAQQRLELKHAFQNQGGMFAPNGVGVGVGVGVNVGGMMAPPIQLTLPQQRPQWSRTQGSRPNVNVGVNGNGGQGSPQNGHASPPGQLLSVPQGF